MKNRGEEIRHIVRDKYGGARDERKLARDRARLAKGEPLAYVIGWIPFLDCRIGLSRRTFIPRPETEFWVEEMIRTIRRERAAAVAALDLFAGSGCVGVALMKHVQNARVVFADVSENALKQSAQNARANGIERGRYAARKSDILASLRGKRFDLILANPPYIPKTDEARVEESVKKFEPRRALFGGRDGLALIERFIRAARGRLRQGGEVWMEFYPPQARTIKKLIREAGFGWSDFRKDQYGRTRFVRFGLE